MKLKIGNKKFLVLFLLASFCFGFSLFAADSDNLDDEYYYLVEKYSPNFLFDSEENYYPCDTTEFYYDNDFNEIPGQLARQDYDNLLLEEKLDKFKVFYKIKDISENEIVVQYWLFYVFNDFGNEHYGDGESVFVFVNKNTEKINRIIGSAHLGSKTKIIFANNELSNPKFEHINILVEKGSHANWIDGNNNELVNKLLDISNPFNSYGGSPFFRSWSLEDKLNGIKINYSDQRYKFVKLSELESKLQGKEKLEKSLELGFWSFTISGKTFYVSQILPFGLSGGGSGDFRAVQKVANNPESVRPITGELLFEKIRTKSKSLAKSINNISRGAVQNFQASFSSIFSSQVGLSGTTTPRPVGTVPTGRGEKVLDIKAIVGSNPTIAEEETVLTRIDILAENKQKSLAVTKLNSEILEQEKIKSQNEEKERLAQMEKQIKLLQREIEFTKKKIEVAKYLQNKKLEQKKQNPKNQNKATLAINRVSKVSKVSSFVPVHGGQTPTPIFIASNAPVVAELEQQQNNDEGNSSDGDNNADNGNQDQVFPDTILEDSPENPSSLTEAIFIFSSDQESPTFECKLDEGEWEECLSPATFSDLSEQEHIFQVRATDEFGNTDETPATFEWEIVLPIAVLEPEPVEPEIDTTSPETMIEVGPANPSDSSTAIFEFLSSEENSAFECVLDENEWETCSSPKTISDLTEANHIFQVRATDEFGNIDETPATFEWEIVLPIAVLEPEPVEPELEPEPPLSPVFDEIESTQNSLSFNLSWQPEELEPVDYYKLEYKEVAEEWIDIGTVLENTYLFSGEDGKTYKFRIKTINKDNQESEWSEELEIKISLNKGVIINEIAWMGTKSSAFDEWIELYNNTDAEIDLTGWSLKTEDESPNILFSKNADENTNKDIKIDAKGYFLLERTDDCAVSNVSADFIYTGALNNNPKCEVLYLYNSAEELVDKTVCLEDGENRYWPAGENSPNKISMERIDPQLQGGNVSNWQSNRILIKNGEDDDGNIIYGTPGQPNSHLAQNIQITELPFDNFDELTFYTSNSPFVISMDMIISEGKKLTIEQGVVLRIYNKKTITNEGEILAQGTEGEKIVFTSFDDSDYGGEGIDSPSDYWKQIILNNVDNNTKFENCIFRYGGKSEGQSYNIAVYVNAGSPEFKNVKFENFVSYAMELNNSSALAENSEFYGAIPIKIVSGNPILRGNYFEKGSVAIDIKDSQALIENNTIKNFTYDTGAIRVENGYPSFINNTFENNAINGIRVFGKVAQNWTLEPAVYTISLFEISENFTLTIKSGAIMKFFKLSKFSKGPQLKVLGILNAGNLNGEPVVFTSILDDVYGGDTNNNGSDELATKPGIGDWDRLDILGNQESLFKNAIFRYAGQKGKGAIYAKDSIADLDNVKIENSRTGIYSLNSDLTIDNSQFLDCGNSYACLKSENTGDMQTDLEISDSVFKENHIGLYVDGNNLTLSDLIFENNTFCGTYFKDAFGALENCPDLSSITFINNTTDVYPDTCPVSE